MHSKINSKGQVTIPSALRRNFGLGKGSLVEFFPMEEFVAMRPAQQKSVLPKSGFGMFKSKKKHIDADFDVATIFCLARSPAAIPVLTSIPVIPVIPA